VWQDWRTNYRKTVSCSHAGWPYFFSNGSSLMTNGWNGNPRGCMIINPPDTFPGQYIVKVDSLGLFDSTFQHTTNGTVTGFWPYDSTRILAFGLPRTFTQYDGQTVNGLCRIYLDGTLDTTFKSPIIPGNGGFRPNLVEENGKIFITGGFQVYDHPNEWFSMLKLNADGSLDTTFNNLGRPIDTNYVGAASVGQVLKMPDNGYLVGGYFHEVQGYPRNGLVKLDSMGNIETQYFTSRGPDSSHFFKTQGSISKILKSKFGGYYVIGDWTYWDGKPSQPIVRLHELSVGLKEKQLQPTLLNVYPNPTQNQLHLTFMPNSRITLIQLFDLQGKIVLTERRETNTLSVSHLKNGVYFLKVIGENGVSTEKVVVRR
jgi:hypothetical protein